MTFETGRLARLALPGVAAVFLSALLSAQTPTGEIRIEVRDPSGAAMQVSGRVENAAAGVIRRFQTDFNGSSVVSGLSYGTYRLQVMRAGFATYSENVKVESAAPVVRTVSMEIGTGTFSLNVVSGTPLPGGDVDVDQIAAPVQSLTDRDLEQTTALDLSQFLNRRLDGVHINETQGNPFQPDLNYRGYTASPLLGTPEGISVYMDGVRMNQPFGDVVSWDLIPKVAISETALIPGSNPLFGLNTLGGALSIQTKGGMSKPGTSVQVSGGSFGRRAVEFEHGGSSARGLNWYLAGNLFHEDGWRQASPSDVRQAFTKLGWQGAKTSVNLSGSYAGNELIGNGLQDQRLLANDYSSVYTLFDRTINRSPFLNLSIRHASGARLTLSGNVYFRYIRADTFNGDVNDNSLDQSLYQPSAGDIRALMAAGITGYPLSGATAANTPFPFYRCLAQVLLNDEPGEKCNGQINRTYTRQHNYGLSGQGTWFEGSAARHNQLTIGAAHDRNSVGFQQTGQLGYINPDKTITPVNAVEDGLHAGNVDGVPLDARVSLRGLIHTSGIYAADNVQLGRAWAFNLSGRYNRTIVDNTDRIVSAGLPGSLTGHNIFERFNPSVGLTYSPDGSATFYASYSEGSRAPTSIELGCADPKQPCKLPNSFAGDPPLRQVVTRTYELGVRGRQESGLSWNVSLFRAQNNDDILFVSSSVSGFGYFRNFGKTQREGVEANVSGRFRRATLGTGYTFLDATYRSSETIDGSSNSSNDTARSGTRGLDGSIDLTPGDRIPLTPQHLLKAWVDYQVTSKLSVDLDFQAVSSSFARGNENNLNRPDGVYYLGSGTSPGYGVLNLGAHYQLHKHAQIFAQINNALDHRYYTAAQLGATAFTSRGNFIARPFPAAGGEYPLQHVAFYAPGAPIGAFGGLKISF